MTRWSQDELDEFYIRRQDWTEFAGTPDAGPDQIPKPIIPDSRMNKTEARFADYLEQLKHMKEIMAWLFEPMKFILAQNVKRARNGTVYIPDFLAVYPGHFTFYEVKGFWRDDALVKIKVAADMFPWFNWIAVQWKKDQWVFNKF